MSGPVQAAIFDIDGTLVESVAVDAELYVAAVTDVLGDVRWRSGFDAYEHVTDSGILAGVLEDNGYEWREQVVSRVQAQFAASVGRYVETDGGFRSVDGAVAFFDALRQRENTAVGIATGGWRDAAVLKLESAWFRLGDTPLTTSDDARSRVEIMRLALDRLGGTFDSITYFGDGTWDRRACLELGWNFVPVGINLGGLESYTLMGPDLQGP